MLSGDTRFSANLVKHAKGADVIIHEVMAATESTLAREAAQRVMAHHMSPEDAARVFAEVGRDWPCIATMLSSAFPGTSSSGVRGQRIQVGLKSEATS